MDEKNTAVIDLTNVEEVKDEELGDHTKSRGSAHAGELFSRLTSSVWSEGRARAETAIKSYGNVDALRPYFDVEPKEVLQRLIRSFVPVKPTGDFVEAVPAELYGPVMICFTLVALLLFEMKYSGFNVQEGTLMGSAMITCFGYWLGMSALLWLVAYIRNSRLRPMQINTLLGYSLTGHCIVVFMTTLIHPAHDHMFFYLLWGICGGLCTLRLVTVFISHTPGDKDRMVLAVVLGVLHMLFLLYLHFAYHQIIQELSAVIMEKKLPDSLKHVQEKRAAKSN